MSKTTKIILIVLGVIVLCCCVLGIGGYFFLEEGITYFAEEMIVDDPAEIQEVAADIAEYQLPAGYEEEFVMNIFGIQALYITNQSKGSMIMMMHFDESLYGSEDLQDQFQESFMQQYGSNDIDFVYVGDRTVEINGEDAVVQVYEGSDSQGYDYVQWVTVFRGDNGSVMVMIIGSASTWSDAEMESFLTSID